MRTREEHVEWCKAHALEFLREFDYVSAVASMINDMNQREDCHVAPVLVTLGMLHVKNHDPIEIRRWIEGFR